MKNAIGVIGAGSMAQFHFNGFEATKTPVAVVADVNPKAAKAGADRFGARATGDWHEVINDPDVKTVAVFTLSSQHYDGVKAALEAGKHVISEKTLTLSPAQSLELGKLAEKKGLILYTSYMKRFFPALQKANSLMPKLGHVMSAYFRTYQGVDGCNMHTGEVLSYFKPDATGVSPIVSKSGGGILVCGGSHVFDLLHFLLGNVTRVYSRSFTRPNHDADFMHHAMFDLPGGGVAHFEGNWHPLKRVGYEQNGWEETIEISGVNGRLLINLPTWDKPLRTPATLSYYDNDAEAWTEFAFDRIDPFIAAETYFQKQIAEGQQGEQDRYTGYRTDLLLALAAQSAKEGKPIDVKYEV